MSELRSEINRILNSNLPPVPLETALMRAIDEERDRWLPRDGSDQGVSRLQLVAFLSGWSGPWNGGGDNPWVRYRGHQINRTSTPDGYVAETTYLDHEGTTTRAAAWSAGSRGRFALDAVKMIDQLLDVVIEHHGVPGDEIPDAEVVDLVDGATALRVLEAWQRWLPAAVARGLSLPALPAGFAAAIDAGEVTP